MKIRLLRYWTLTLDLLMLALLLSAPVQAQEPARDPDVRMAEREQRMEERRIRREEFMAANPDIAARLEERRANREEFLETNPEVAARMEDRRARMREFMEEHPEARGRMGRRGNEGPPRGQR